MIKITDFGLARTIQADQAATTTAGTPGYVAPEIIMKLPYDQKCDYWSLAVTLFVLMCGCPPFYHEDNFELFEIIKSGKYDFDAPAWENVSEEAKDFLSKLLVIDPNVRMDMD
jgi:calcium/calmodulin-dependent protein kinase I